MLNYSVYLLTFKAIEKCLEAQMPFACYALPGESEVHFYADDSQWHSDFQLSRDDVDGFEGFLISTYGIDDNKQFFGVSPRLSASDVLSRDITKPKAAISSPSWHDTDYSQYIADVEDISGNLSGEGEKAVYARQKVVESRESITAIAFRYFSAHPDCFRFYYYTPLTGTWFGASPELLLDFNKVSGELKTMALAGTRPALDKTPWSRKNCLEHDIVVKSICEVFRSLHSDAVCGDTASLQFSAVEHLFTPISAHITRPLSEVICKLSPTPALCGWPTDKAHAMIISHEKFPRLCYGGSVGVCSKGKALLYVNLRSVEACSAGKSFFRVIAGGGITIYSDADEEWNETENKMKSLIDIITPV